MISFVFKRIILKKVPPEAMHPPVSQEGSFKSKTNEEPREAATNYTYRTEIVGNVVMKKKISESKLVSGVLFVDPIQPI